MESGEIFKMRECIDVFFFHRIIDRETYIELLKKVDQLKKKNYMFITKPFRTCDSMGHALYNMMRSLKRNMQETITKMKQEKDDENKPL